MSESLLEGAGPIDKDQSKDISQMGHPVSGGMMMGSREAGSPYLSMIPQDDVDPEAELSYLGPSSPLPPQGNTQDMYYDDELLQDELAMNFQPQVLPSQARDHIRSVYNRGNYAIGEQKNRESFPYLEGNGYSSFSNQPSVDYPSSYQDSYSLPPPRTSPRPTTNLGLSEDVMDNSLFIGSIPPGGGSSSFSRGYNPPSLDNEDAYSPRPFDIPPQRPHYRDLEPVPHDMRYDYGGQMSYFPDGGVGIGTRNYRNSLMSEPEGWTRSHSLSRNMNFVDTYDMDPARPYGYSALRPQVPTHSSQLSLNEMSLRRDFESMPDFAYSGKLSPHHLPTRDPYADEYEGGGGGYLGRPGMVENHSYMGSLGLLDTEKDLPMPRARSMMYLGTQDDVDYNDSALLDDFHAIRQPAPQDAAPMQSGPEPTWSLRSSLDESALENAARKPDSPVLSHTADSVHSADSSNVAELKQESESENSVSAPADSDSKSWTKVSTRSEGRTPRMDPKFAGKSDSKFGSPSDDQRAPRRSVSPIPEWRSRPNRSPRAQGDRSYAPGLASGPGPDGARSPRPASARSPTFSGSRSPRPRDSRSPQPPSEHHGQRGARYWDGRYWEGDRHAGKAHFQDGNAHPYGEHGQPANARFGGSSRSQGPRDRSPTSERSRSPYPGQAKGSGATEGGYRRDDIPSTYQFACRDFENGICLRGDACKFYHDPKKGRDGGRG